MVFFNLIFPQLCVSNHNNNNGNRRQVRQGLCHRRRHAGLVRLPCSLPGLPARHQGQRSDTPRQWRGLRRLSVLEEYYWSENVSHSVWEEFVCHCPGGVSLILLWDKNTPYVLPGPLTISLLRLCIQHWRAVHRWRTAAEAQVAALLAHSGAVQQAQQNGPLVEQLHCCRNSGQYLQ